MKPHFFHRSTTLAFILSASPALAILPPLSIPPGYQQQLSDTLVSGGNVMVSQVTPDSSTVVYIADQDADDVLELYSVRLADGEVVKLNESLGPDKDIYHFEISPDSSTVIYVADQDTDNIFELYSVPVSGGASTKVHPDLDLFGSQSVGSFSISPDGNSILFVADLDPTADTQGIFRTSLTGGAVSTVAGPLPEGRRIEDFRISPDGSTVVYRADADLENHPALYSVPIDGGVSTAISGVIIGLGDGVESFEISPDGSQVVYIKESFGSDLYSVPLTGGSPTRLNDRLYSMGNPFPISEVQSFAISPDSSTVVYRSDQDTADVNEIYAVPIEGGSPDRLNGSLVADGQVRNFAISGDSSKVIYRADQDVDEVYELYKVSLAGGSDSKLNNSLVAGGDVTSFRIIPDSSGVIYTADQDDDNEGQIYHIPMSGGSATALNPSLVSGGDVVPATLTLTPPHYVTPDSTTVIYLADQDTDNVFELHAVWIDGEESGPTIGSSLAELWQRSHFTLRQLANPWKRATLCGWNADPDGDGLVNLMEYALDGDPHVASLQFTDGSYMGAELEIDGSLVEVRFPERTDAGLRGLEYELEYSTNMENWFPIPTSAPILQTPAPYNPTIPGFQQSVWRWNMAHDRLFIRLRASFVTLMLL